MVSKKSNIFVGLLVLVTLLVGILSWLPDKTSAPTTGPSGEALSEAASLRVIVNKQRPLNPKSYVPAKLVVPDVPLRRNITDDEKRVSVVISPDLKALIGAAQQAGLALDLQSGYRSYDFQKKLYNSYVKTQGKAQANIYSAKAGYSEHQTGLAVDIGSVSNSNCNVKDCFAGTPESKWLAANAHTYGFVIRYPEGKQSVTGYAYEPWHLRYVGKALAAQIDSANQITLEEYFKVQ